MGKIKLPLEGAQWLWDGKPVSMTEWCENQVKKHRKLDDK